MGSLTLDCVQRLDEYELTVQTDDGTDYVPVPREKENYAVKTVGVDDGVFVLLLPRGMTPETFWWGKGWNDPDVDS